MKHITSIGLIATALLLQGCLATVPRLDTVVDRIDSAARSATQPAAVTQYKAAVDAEYKLFERTFDELKPATVNAPDGLNNFVESEVLLKSSLMTYKVKVLREVRLAMPADAVLARHKAAAEALSAFATYAAKRPDATDTRLFVTGPSAADTAWMAAQLRKGGARDVEELQQAFVSVGFTSPGLKTERQIN